MDLRTCSISSCEGRVLARGWCRPHYRRWRAHGDPLEGQEKRQQPDTCAINECERKPVARGWCSTHYQRWKKTGDATTPPLRPAPRKPTTCDVETCERDVYAHGFCGLHHRRWKRHGDPLKGAAGPRGEPLVDRNGYVRIWMPEHPASHAGRVLEHRVVMEQRLGRYLLPGENVHHVNGDRRDNRIDNLELWVSHQPKGQRVSDLLEWAREILARYEGVDEA